MNSMEERDDVPPHDDAEGSAFSLASIRPVRDPTARRTLEQAHAFVDGLARIMKDAESDPEAARLVRELAEIGLGPAEAEHVAAQAVELLALMADRDRKADVFHAAVRAAGQGERAMGERLAAISRQLRQRLGTTAPALARFGVPPDVPEEARPKSKPAPPAAHPLWSASTTK